MPAVCKARSTNGGRTFTQKTLGRVFDDLNCYPIFAGRQTLSDEYFRLNSFPSFSVDLVSGKIYVVWADDRANAGCGGSGSFAGSTSNQVVLVSGTWASLSSPAAVTSGQDKVFPAVAANNGKAAITFYTRDYAFGSGAPGDVCHFATSSAGGANVTPSASTSNVCLDYAG